MSAVASCERPRRVLFIRTFVPLKGGGAVPPTGLLYLAAALRAAFGARVDLRIRDTGCIGEAEVLRELETWDPDIVGLSTLSCEADCMHRLAAAAKLGRSSRVVVVGGPHASVTGAQLLSDAHIDLVAVGEGERTIVEWFAALEAGSGLAQIAGLCWRGPDGPVVNASRAPIEDLDTVPFPAWDLVDLRVYGAQPTWAGALKEPFYATLVSSRGCPYGCNFCHNLFGKQVRKRSAPNIVAELREVHQRFGVREFHVVDDIFNIDRERVRAICEGVIALKLPLCFAFPNGLRADILTEELVDLLRRAGTYKVNFGFETVSPRLQEAMGKKLDIPKAVRIIDKTAKTGIITGAYFMMGLPTETRAEVQATIDFAVASNLDVAYFFKATAFPGSGLHTQVAGQAPVNDSDLHFYSVSRSYGNLTSAEVNELMLQAQQRFYLRPRRLWRGFWKAHDKSMFFKNLLSVLALLVQASLVRALVRSKAAKEAA